MPALEEPKIFTVREFTRDAKAILEAAFDSVWIEGEISNLRTPSSGHSYFVLKDNAAQVRCVLFKGYRSGMKYRPEDGDHVVLFGRATVYEARGEYQVIVEMVEPHGLGALQKAFDQLKKKLSEEGLFAEERKRPLPEFPWKVGIVTSPTGAAIRDMLNVIRRRNHKTSVLLYPAKVQGEGAAEEVARGIQALNQIPDVDVIIVGRGGGSLEDLWAFNEEVLARAIYQSKTPVVSAVGHEVDFTIADFVADLRAPTPSAAAELVVPELSEMVALLRSETNQLINVMRRQIEERSARLLQLSQRRRFRNPQEIFAFKAQRLDDLDRRLMRGLDQWALFQRKRLENAARRLLLGSPLKMVQRMQERLDSRRRQLTRCAFLLTQTEQERLRNSARRLETRMPVLIERRRERFEGLARRLHSLSPLAVLDRGYSICSHEGKALKDSGKVQAGDSVEIRLAQGQLKCKVEGK